VPRQYLDYLLCKHFGWTPSELDSQPSDRILEFLTIIRIEGSFQSIEQQKLEAEMNQHG
jgi:hypothetical protein